MLLAICDAGFATDLPAAVANLPIHKGQAMSSARKALLKAGWVPRKTYLKDGDGTFASDDPEGQQFVRLGYLEIEACAVDGPWCNLNYTNSKHDCLVVTTKGENPKTIVVEAWTFICPDDEDLTK